MYFSDSSVKGKRTLRLAAIVNCRLPRINVTGQKSNECKSARLPFNTSLSPLFRPLFLLFPLLLLFGQLSYAQIGLAKAAYEPNSPSRERAEPGANGTYTLHYTFEIENFEGGTMTNIRVVDDLAGDGFGTFNSTAQASQDPNDLSAGEYYISTSDWGGDRMDVNNGGLDINNNFDGETDTELLLSTSSLGGNTEARLLLHVVVKPGFANAGIYSNTATAYGSEGGEDFTDISWDSRFNSDPDDDDDPTNNTDPAVLAVCMPNGGCGPSQTIIGFDAPEWNNGSGWDDNSQADQTWFNFDGMGNDITVSFSGESPSGGTPGPNEYTSNPFGCLNALRLTGFNGATAIADFPTETFDFSAPIPFNTYFNGGMESNRDGNPNKSELSLITFSNGGVSLDPRTFSYNELTPSDVAYGFVGNTIYVWGLTDESDGLVIFDLGGQLVDQVVWSVGEIVFNNGLITTSGNDLNTGDISFDGGTSSQWVTGFCVNEPACTTPNPPVLQVDNNVCPATTGSFTVVTPCSAGSTIEYSIDNGATWSTTLPAWADGLNLIAHCVDNTDNSCVSSNSNTVTAQENICPTGDCNCVEYLYVNDTDLNQVHKFAVNPATGNLTEVDADPTTTGTVEPWLSGISNPHGLASDINGFLYIGELFGDVWRIRCDGTPISQNFFDTSGKNFAEFENLILTNSEDGLITAWDPCDPMNPVGTVQLIDENNNNAYNNWGLYKDGNGTYYASGGTETNDLNAVWKFDLELSDLTSGTTFSPLIDNSDFPTGARIYGVTADAAGNIYVYYTLQSPDFDNVLEKYDSNGNPVNSVVGNWNAVGWDRAQGIVYSADADVVYISGGAPSVADCVGFFDPVTLNYTGVIPHVPGQDPKGIAINKECCPATTPLIYNETVCTGGNGAKVFLNEVFNCGDGTVCEGAWSVETANGNQSFNSCDLSITVTGNGCGTYVLEKTGAKTGAQQCDPFRIEVTVCTEAPTATVTPAQGTCAGNAANNDAVINLTAVSGDEAGIIAGADYTGGPTYGSGNLDVSGGTGTFTGLLHTTTYTIRVFNGSADCFSDYTVTTPNLNCTQPCALSIDLSNQSACNDNGTGTNASDDYFTINVNASATNGGSQYQVVLNANADGTGGTVLGTANYGSMLTVGDGTNGATGTFAADGTTTYTVTVRDATDNTCHDEFITNPVSSCAVALYSLGNQVFYDDDNSGTRDLGENGVDGIILQLLNASGSVYDSDPSTPGTQILSVATANGGYYRFDDLPAGSYIVEIIASAFTSGGTLENYSSSSGAGEEISPDADGDDNDNGLDSSPSGTIRSGLITLGGVEPLGETEPSSYTTGSFTGTPAADAESNLTVDFGFYRQRDRPDCCDDTRPPCAEEPCHFISNDIYLGSGVTNDASSINSGTADGDTDDGIFLNDKVQITPGNVINLPVSFYNATSSDAYLRGWIDWNADGDFDDTGEQVTDLLLPAAIYSGSQVLSVAISIPQDAVLEEQTAIRWRISTDAVNTTSPCGNGSCANDGEIEDYLLRLSCPVAICPVSTVTLIRN